MTSNKLQIHNFVGMVFLSEIRLDNLVLDQRPGLKTHPISTQMVFKLTCFLFIPFESVFTSFPL